jgi:GTPase SAR1 family protein
MHQNNMLKVKESALALLKGQQAVLRQISNTPGLVNETADGQARVLDKQRLVTVLEVLEGEISKVDNLEAVIAVVGTMKAGKSTTINAITGTEVLPNRNQPMTTMPTLIRHTPGRKDPVLEFPKTAPILALEAGVRGRLQALQARGGFDKLDTWHQANGRELIQRILAGRGDWIGGRHVGVDEIFIVLRDLNDLVRLAREAPIGLSLGDDDYDEIHELPVIEVEFTHLAKTAADGLGRLTLLDTPGPNEAGQGDALLNIMKEQLEKASAVLAVLDYTQLLSTADEQVRSVLRFLSTQLGDRTFALVNRFDQRNANCMPEAEVRNFVTKSLLDIEAERVFPASGLIAYLSSRLLTSLEVGEDVRGFKDAPWFRDFANMANLDDEELDNREELARQAKKFWKKSQFEPLLTQVIARGHQQAAQICIEAALAKMSDYGGTIEEFLALRKGGVTQEVAQLQRMVDHLRTDIRAANAAEKRAEALLNGMTDRFANQARLIFLTTQTLMREAVRTYFEEGREDERNYTKEKERIAEQERRAQQSALDVILSFARERAAETPPPTAVRQQSDDKITFPDREKAVNFAGTITERIKEIISDGVKDGERALEEAATKLRDDLGTSTSDEVGAILERAQQTLKDGGIDLTIAFPAPNFNADQTAISTGDFDAIGTRSWHETRKRAKKGIGAWFARKLWGGGYYEEVVEFTETTVDVEAIRRGVDESLTRAEDDIGKRASEFVNDEIKPAIEEYFERLRNHLEGYRTVLLDGIGDQERDKERLAELRRHIENVAEQAGMHRQDLMDFRQHLPRVDSAPARSAG